MTISVNVRTSYTVNMFAHKYFLHLLLVKMTILAAVRGEETIFKHDPISSSSFITQGHPAHPAYLTCQTHHPALIHWTINGERISNTTRRYYSATSSTSSKLRITRINRIQDSGPFACVADTGGGKTVVSSPTTINIAWLENPIVELEEPFNMTDFVIGSDITLQCEADVGGPDIQYHWFRNAERLTSKSQRIDVKKKKLHIKQASAKDNGVYRCSVHLDGLSKESTTNFVLNVKDSSLPQLIVQPDDLLVAPRSSAEFKCQFKNADSIAWYKNDGNVPLENGERISIDSSYNLKLTNVTRRDEGTYSCVAYKNNEKTLFQRFSGRLRVAYLKPLSYQDLEPPVEEWRVFSGHVGHPLQISCLPPKDAIPPPNIMWKNINGHLISDSENVDVHVNDNSLIIKSLQARHQGVYTCMAENIAGSQEISIFVIAIQIPKMTKTLADVIVNENEPSKFKCEFHNNKQTNLYFDVKKFWSKIVDDNFLRNIGPKLSYSNKHIGEREFPQYLLTVPNSTDLNVPPNKELIMTRWLVTFNWDLYELVWKKDNGKIVKEQGHIVIISHEGVLKFQRTQASDKGIYWCELQTLAGETVKSNLATLTVREKLKFSPPPVSKKLEMFSLGKIHCKAQGTPIPNLSWYKNVDEPLPEDVSSINGTLYFSRVLREHKGNYTCVANSSQGNIHTTISIDVVVSPRFISPLPSQIIDVNEGEQVWLDCIAEGDPTPKTQWDRDLNTIIPDSSTADNNSNNNKNDTDRLILMDNGTFYIKWAKLEDSDHYGCTAGNSGGLKREEIVLVVHSSEIVPVNEEGVISKAIFITMSVVSAYILLVISLMLWCRARRRRKLANNIETEKLENGEVELKEKDNPDDKLLDHHESDHETGYIEKPKKLQNGTKNGILNAAPRLSDNSENSKKSAAYSASDKLTFHRSQLKNITQIGRGEFGDVFVATWQLDPSDGTIINKGLSGCSKQVMLKSLTNTKDEDQLLEFKRQLDMFSRLSHSNIANFLGLSNEQDPHMLVFEYSDWGDLKQFLLATRTPEEVLRHKELEKSVINSENQLASTVPLTLLQKLALVYQLSCAMEHISDNRLVHKDLATRNCVITSKLSIKVAMPSLSKDTYSREYCKHINQVIPLRWLPQESVFESDYSSKSDIYMFACTVWEIFHKGEFPFIKLNDNTVLTQLKNNTLNWQINDTDMTQPLMDLLKKCWDVSPKVRPNFTETTQEVHQILKNTANKK